MSSGTHPLPPELDPVLSFVNSVDIELDTDEWAAGPPALAGWLTLNGLLNDGDVRVTSAEFGLARDLRAGLRAMTLANNGVPAEPAVLDDLRAALRAFPLTVRPDAAGGGALTGTVEGPVMAALGVVVAGYATGLLTGAWARMRQCPAGDCAWVFWDSSARSARRWCKMRVCGNRAKVRAFAERQRAAEIAGPG
ncbi:CGNR zinc finger domain-containing protein [Dactylosporangium sp. NPDC048998]|uniref:CGNR zinc finger domain-containing protein n=1 Tax=Dactylosporangium sp. NPDC048998 TaxID=3363976 RepID=UPI00371831D0